MPVNVNFDKFRESVTQNAFNRIRDICVSAVAEGKTNMHYMGGTPSEPGEWPNIQSRSLQATLSYDIKLKGHEVTGFFGIIPWVAGGQQLGGGAAGEARGYPYWLEVGTKRMAPRPWMTFTMNHIEDKFGIHFERHV
jgi:hypothetical protein